MPTFVINSRTLGDKQRPEKKVARKGSQKCAPAGNSQSVSLVRASKAPASWADTPRGDAGFTPRGRYSGALERFD